MENLLILVNIILAVILIIVILLQRSEGGALGLGVSQDNFTSARSVGTFLTKFTSIIATLFIVCSIAIVAISRDEIRETQSVLEKEEEENSNLPQIPQSKLLRLCNSQFLKYNILPWRDTFSLLAAWSHL